MTYGYSFCTVLFVINVTLIEIANRSVFNEIIKKSSLELIHYTVVDLLLFPHLFISTMVVPILLSHHYIYLLFS